MDRLFVIRSRFSLVRVPVAVCVTAVVSGTAQQPIAGLHRNDQLRLVLASQDPVRPGRKAALGSISCARNAARSHRLLRTGGLVVAVAREAVPGAETILLDLVHGLGGMARDTDHTVAIRFGDRGGAREEDDVAAVGTGAGGCACT